MRNINKIGQQLGDVSLALRIQNILSGLAQGRLPSAVQLISVVRSIIYRIPRVKRIIDKQSEKQINKINNKAIYNKGINKKEYKDD